MPNSVSLVSELDALNITSDNIKDGVNILGVEGTYKGDSVVDDELRAVVAHTENRSRNVLTKTVEGSILHVEDAYVTDPREIVVNGAYEQDGTPTPDAPIEIVTVTSIELCMSGADTTSYTTTPLPLVDSNSNTYELVGLKDGFGDKLRITDNGDGTADVVLYKSTKIDTLPTTGWALSDSEAKFGLANAVTQTPYTGETNYVYNGISNRFSNVGLYEVGTYSITIWNSKYVDITYPDITTSEEFNTWIASNPIKVAYPLETPEVISLGTINLSALPENISNLWVNSNIPTTLQMTYERDIQSINKANVNAIATLIADVEFGLNEQGYLESYVPITAAYAFALNDDTGELEVVG